MSDWCDRQIAALRKLNALPNGSEARWRSFLSAVERVRTAQPLLNGSECDLFVVDGGDGWWTSDDLIEGADQNAFTLFLHFPVLAHTDGISTARDAAKRYIRSKLRDQDYFGSAAVEDIMDLGIVGERLGLWSGGAHLMT